MGVSQLWHNYVNPEILVLISDDWQYKSTNQGGEGRVSEAKNLRSSSAIQSVFNFLGRTGKIIIFIIQVGIWRCNEHGKR